MPLIKRCTETVGDTRQDVGEQRTGRPATRSAAQLLMIKSCDHLDSIAVVCVDHGDDARVHAAQIVEAARSEEFLMRSEDRRLCGVVHPQVVAIDVDRRAARGLSYVIKYTNARMPNAPDRCGVELLVQPEALVVHTAIKMDSQLRYPHDRLGAHQLHSAVAEHQPTCQSELAIQPGVEQRSAVDLYTELLPAVAAEVGPRLKCETSRIRVRAEDPERHERSGVIGDPPRDQCAV